MKVVLSAPMSSVVNHNFPALDAARDRLIAAHFEVVSPADIDRTEKWVYEWGRKGTYNYQVMNTPAFYYEIAMARCFAEIEAADGIVLLEGWQDSPGCQREHNVARSHNKRIYKMAGDFLYEIGIDGKVVAIQALPGREVPGAVCEPDRECDLRWGIDCTCDYHPEAHVEKVERAPRALDINEDDSIETVLRNFRTEGEDGRRWGIVTPLTGKDESIVRKMVDILKDAKMSENAGEVRRFDTGATRDVAEHKYDYEGFISPLVVREFGRYMHEHRLQTDGTLRNSDNWQKGMPLDVYMKSAWRHFHDLWMMHRGYEATDFDGNEVTLADALCALLFNVQGYLHSLLAPDEDEETT